MRAIYLVGLMGSGKSTVGRALAKDLKWRFADTDALVVKRAGRSIKRIFDDLGESGFRVLEQQALRSLAKGNWVVATGGGIVLRAENRVWMKRHGVTVHLKVPLRILKQRLTGAQAIKRPLLASLTEMARKRARFYASSELAVAADRPPDAVVRAILRQIRRKKPQVLADKTAR